MITQINIVKEPEYYYPAGMVEKDGLMTYPESQKLSSIPTPSNIVTKSSTAGLLKNDGTVDSNSYVKKSDIETEKTATGNPITLTDAIAGNALEVSAEIVASQDLHGYDKPWVGGAGKNKLPFDIATIKSLNTSGTWNGNTYAKSGVTVTVSDDGTYSVVSDGTLSDTFIFYLGDISGNGLILNGCPSGGSDNTYKIQAFKSGASFNDYGNGVSITDNDSRSYRIVVYASAGAISKMFKPMLSSAGGTFAPYSNICPITGFSSVTITDVDAEGQTATVTVSLGSTVYGGTLDLTSGELTVTHAIVDIGDITWNLAGSGSEAFFWYNITDKSNGSAVISTCYEYVGKKSDTEMKQSPTGVIAITNNYDVKIKDLRYNTAAAFKTAMTGQKILYELATPTTTTLTAAQLALVKGYNQLSCNSGDMEITYKASSLDAWKDRVNELDNRVDELEDAVEDIEDRVNDVETALAGKANIEPYLEQSVTLSTSQTTTVTFTDAKILATSFIEPAISVWGIFPEDVTVANGSCTVVMPQVSSAQTVTVGIFIKR